MMHETEDAALVFIDGPLKLFVRPATRRELFDALDRMKRYLEVAAGQFEQAANAKVCGEILGRIE